MIARIVEDSGSDRAPVVYVPGIDGTGEFLFRTAAPIAERFRLVRLAYESREGQACSAAGYHELAASIARVLEELGLERPILLAESFGVAVALRTALDHPARVGALALVNGFARYERRFSIKIGATLAPLLPASLFDLGRRFLVPGALFGPRKTKEVLRAFFDVPGGRYDRGYRCRLAMIADVDLLPELARVQHPVHLFASDRDKVVPSAKAARRMAAVLPRARIEDVERAGHLILPFESRRWVERLVALEAEIEA